MADSLVSRLTAEKCDVKAMMEPFQKMLEDLPGCPDCVLEADTATYYDQDELVGNLDSFKDAIAISIRSELGLLAENVTRLQGMLRGICLQSD